MHGRACEEKKRVRHMWTVPSRATASVSAAGSSSLVLSSPSSFLKDGRKISVGDCALFKPPEDCPPFIGIIRWIAAGKENQIKLGVNWLYRPAELKLGKGILLEAAPNEIFYSFHKDEIPAASILHPCKVAFLPKGAELPSGICSFVCRRVYDITNKCLWWLTDQDYVDERQEEVDQLLYKTRVEMHATVPPGGRSPKPVNGPSSTSQLKPGSDSVQNSSSYSSQVRGKKRERVDQSSEVAKRERSSRMEDNESAHSRLEASLKCELAKITEKGGLVDSEGVEKLVQLMLPERNEKKIDLTCRSMLAGVVAATDKLDCLSRFVQLRGLPVFDEWLQEIHKGKIGDGSPKEGDKSTEDFLVILLRALDKLPVNLNALQMCNIGKSVNHLRTHKNLDIQRKARSLVDTWKKRVEVEMDMKSGGNQGVSWSGKSRLHDASHGGNRHSGGSSDLATKTSTTHVAAAKLTSLKSVQGENNAKSASASQVSLKAAPSHTSGVTNLRDGQLRNSAAAGVSDSSLAAPRDEKSSSSSQSHNNSQSCSSDQARTGGLSGKEDARTSTAVSMSVNKSSSGSSRHRRSANGLHGSSPSNAQKEIVSSRISFQRNGTSEKSSQSASVCEKACDVPMAEGNGHKLIVKLPNRGRSPGPSANGGSLEDPAVMTSRASSPVLSEKQDQSREKGDAHRVNISSDVNNESWQSNDIKDMLTGSLEGAGSPSTLPEEEQCRTLEVARKPPEVVKTTSPSSSNEFKSGKLNGGSLSSINALVESCAKFSESTTMSVGDDVGMNLLASVAASEISKSDTASPAESPQANNTLVEHAGTRNDSCHKSTLLSDVPKSQSLNGSDGENDKQNVLLGTVRSKAAEDKNIFNSAEGCCRSLESSGKNLLPSADHYIKGNVESNQAVISSSDDVPPASNVEKSVDEDRKVGGATDVDTTSAIKQHVGGSVLTQGKATDSCLKAETEAVVSELHTISANYGSVKIEQTLPIIVKPSESSGGEDAYAQISSGSGKDLISGKADELKSAKTDEMFTSSAFENREQTTDGECNSLVAPEEKSVAGSALSVTNCKTELAEEILEMKEVKEKLLSPKISSPVQGKETDHHGKTRESRLSNEADEGEECTSVTRDTSSVSATGGSDMDAKVGFDLNEGFNGDDGRNGELCNSTGPGSSMPQFVSTLPLPATVTVAAAAKGPFVPPQDLLRNSRGALGWKGSAATSAFRPAEPRKALEMPHGTNATLASSDAIAGKQSRPPLDIDLNVPDERVLEDMASQSSSQVMSSSSNPLKNHDCLRDGGMGSAPARSFGGLDLDLNRVEEPNDMGNYPCGSHRLDTSLRSFKSSSSARIIDEAAAGRDFDLNDGPAIDDINSQPPVINQHARTGTPAQPMLSGIRINGSEMGNYSWFPGTSTYSGVTIPPVMQDRPELPFPVVSSVGTHRMLNPAASPSPFTPDVYRAPVLSSSPAVPFQSSTFQYPMFPFGTSFPLPSATFSGGSATYVDSSTGGRLCFPGANSPLLGSSLSVPPNFARPYVVSLPDGTNSTGSESSRKWLRQGLDLNAGPGAPEQDGRDEASSLALRQLPVSGPQLLTEEQVRMYQISGSFLKRKEPEGGWDGSKPSWH